jgi:hypothetical protein
MDALKQLPTGSGYPASATAGSPAASVGSPAAAAMKGGRRSRRSRSRSSRRRSSQRKSKSQRKSRRHH